MKNRIARALAAAAMSAMLCVSLASPVSAAQNPFAAMEEKSRRAVESAIAAGSIPSYCTMYDCMYSTDDNGVTTVVQYKDKNGNWIDVVSGKAATDSQPGASAEKLSEDELAKYADRVFELVNQEREKAGIALLERDSDLDRGAAIRAEELSIEFSHSRPDGTQFYTVMGDNRDYLCQENIGRSVKGVSSMMKSWMDSEGHRAHILNERNSKIGIGVYLSSDGNLNFVQLFSRPIE